MLPLVLCALSLAAVNASPRAVERVAFDELSIADMRFLAIERGPEGERAWLADAEDSFRFRAAEGQAFGHGRLHEIRWEEGTVVLRSETPPELRRRLGRWLDFVQPSNSMLRGAPFGGEGCPEFLQRVERDAAWVRIGEAGELRRLGPGEELCGGWRVESLTAGGDTGLGLMTLRKGQRQLRVVESPTMRAPDHSTTFGLRVGARSER